MSTTSNVRRSLWSDRSGAMFVMGIPMCFFMIGLLYFVIGLGENLVFRERMQDAADAAALSGAVMYARGMNLIALLNQLMAALVGLLVMIKMLEAVMIAATVVAGALAWPTGGASLSIVPSAESAREEAHSAFDELKEVIDPIVEGIHYVEVYGIQYGMPVLAEVRAIAIASEYQPVASFGVEIPGEFFLPVKNGTWAELCKQAGKAAGALIMLPLEPLIPVKQVRSVIEDGLGGLAGTFSSAFCGHGGTALGDISADDLPSIPIKDDNQFNKNIPELESASECTKQTATDPPKGQFTTNSHGLIEQDPSIAADRAAQRDENEQAKNAICEQAARESQMSRMDATGIPNTRETCTYKWGGDQAPEQTCPEDCLQQPGNKACSFFQEKVDGAYQMCRPGATPNIVQWNYQQRELTWTIELVPVRPCPVNKNGEEECKYRADVKPLEHVDSAQSNGQSPCGPKGFIGTEWRPSTYHANGEYRDDEYLCAQPHVAMDPDEISNQPPQTIEQWSDAFKVGQDKSGWQIGTATLSGPKQADSEAIVLQGHWTAVTFMHSCEQKITDVKQAAKVPKSNSEPPSESNDECKDSDDEVHLKMEPATLENVLGGKTYQIRSIVWRKIEDSAAKKVVRAIPLWRKGDEKDVSSGPLGAAGDVLKKIFAAQAEYYYDTEFDKNAKPEVLDKTMDDRAEWTWNMQWKARIRRLRFLGDDDEDSTCSKGWSSHGTVVPNGTKDKCSQNSDGATEQLKQGVVDKIQERMNGAAAGGGEGKVDSNSIFQSVANNAGSSMNVLPGGGGGGGGDQSDTACGAVSTSRDVESLMIH